MSFSSNTCYQQNLCRLQSKENLSQLYPHILQLHAFFFCFWTNTEIMEIYSLLNQIRHRPQGYTSQSYKPWIKACFPLLKMGKQFIINLININRQKLKKKKVENNNNNNGPFPAGNLIIFKSSWSWLPWRMVLAWHCFHTDACLWPSALGTRSPCANIKIYKRALGHPIDLHKAQI